MLKIDLEKDILTNGELLETGARFQITPSGYKSYLIKRNYGLASDSLNYTTVNGYCYAIERIQRQERVSFRELFDRSADFAYLYGLNGPQRELGDTSKGTWRNALNRLYEFKQYIEICEKKDKKPEKQPVGVCTNTPIKVGMTVRHQPSLCTQKSHGLGTVVKVNETNKTFDICFREEEDCDPISFEFKAIGKVIIIVD